METTLEPGSAMVGERASGKARQAEPGHGTAVQGVAGGSSAVAQVARARQRELRWLGRGKKMK